MVTPGSRLPFGKHKGMRLNQCPAAYLRWVARHLRDTDFHEWAVEAEKLLPAKEAQEPDQPLEADADAFLRRHGVDPKDV